MISKQIILCWGLLALVFPNALAQPVGPYPCDCDGPCFKGGRMYWGSNGVVETLSITVEASWCGDAPAPNTVEVSCTGEVGGRHEVFDETLQLIDAREAVVPVAADGSTASLQVTRYTRDGIADIPAQDTLLKCRFSSLDAPNPTSRCVPIDNAGGCDDGYTLSVTIDLREGNDEPPLPRNFNDVFYTSGFCAVYPCLADNMLTDLIQDADGETISFMSEFTDPQTLAMIDGIPSFCGSSPTVSAETIGGPFLFGEVDYSWDLSSCSCSDVTEPAPHFSSSFYVKSNVKEGFPDRNSTMAFDLGVKFDPVQPQCVAAPQVEQALVGESCVFIIDVEHPLPEPFWDMIIVEASEGGTPLDGFPVTEGTPFPSQTIEVECTEEGDFDIEVTCSDSCGCSDSTTLTCECEGVEQPTEEPGDCCPCNGGAICLTLQNNGFPGVIRVAQVIDNEIRFDGFVGTGEPFQFCGNYKQATFGDDIAVFNANDPCPFEDPILKVQKGQGQANSREGNTIDLLGNAEEDETACSVFIHTSCSVPLYVGQQWGPYSILAGKSRNGGDLCRQDQPPSPTCDRPISEEDSEEVDSEEVASEEEEELGCGCSGFVQCLNLQNWAFNGRAVIQQEDRATVFNGPVPVGGETGIFCGTNMGMSFGAEVFVTLTDFDSGAFLQSKIPTDCSRGIEVGMLAGSWIVTGGNSAGGRPFCEDLDACNANNCIGCCVPPPGNTGPDCVAPFFDGEGFTNQCQGSGTFLRNYCCSATRDECVPCNMCIPSPCPEGVLCKTETTMDGELEVAQGQCQTGPNPNPNPNPKNPNPNPNPPNPNPNPPNLDAINIAATNIKDAEGAALPIVL